MKQIKTLGKIYIILAVFEIALSVYTEETILAVLYGLISVAFAVLGGVMLNEQINRTN